MIRLLSAIALGATATYALLKRSHVTEVESWTDPLREVVRQRDQLQRDYQKLQRFHEDLAEQAREMALELNEYRSEERAAEARVWKWN